MCIPKIVNLTCQFYLLHCDDKIFVISETEKLLMSSLCTLPEPDSSSNKIENEKQKKDFSILKS